MLIVYKTLGCYAYSTLKEVYKGVSITSSGDLAYVLSSLFSTEKRAGDLRRNGEWLWTWLQSPNYTTWTA